MNTSLSFVWCHCSSTFLLSCKIDTWKMVYLSEVAGFHQYTFVFHWSLVLNSVPSVGATVLSPSFAGRVLVEDRSAPVVSPCWSLSVSYLSSVWYLSWRCWYRCRCWCCCWFCWCGCCYDVAVVTCHLINDLRGNRWCPWIPLLLIQEYIVFLLLKSCIGRCSLVLYSFRTSVDSSDNVMICLCCN